MLELTPSRRQLLATAAACATAASLPVVALAAPVDPHPAPGADLHPIWWAEAEGRRRWLDNPANFHLSDDERAICFQAMADLHVMIADTPAATIAGVRSQAAYLACMLENFDLDEEGAVTARLMMATLDRLAGGQAHG